MYKVKCCSEICEKYIDQLLFYPDIETKSEVIDTSQPERNLSLHLYSTILNQIRVIKQLHFPHWTIIYQTTPPLHHHLNLLTPQFQLNQT